MSVNWIEGWSTPPGVIMDAWLRYDTSDNLVNFLGNELNDFARIIQAESYLFAHGRQGGIYIPGYLKRKTDIYTGFKLGYFMDASTQNTSVNPFDMVQIKTELDEVVFTLSFNTLTNTILVNDETTNLTGVTRSTYNYYEVEIGDDSITVHLNGVPWVTRSVNYTGVELYLYIIKPVVNSTIGINSWRLYQIMSLYSADELQGPIKVQRMAKFNPVGAAKPLPENYVNLDFSNAANLEIINGNRIRKVTDPVSGLFLESQNDLGLPILVDGQASFSGLSSTQMTLALPTLSDFCISLLYTTADNSLNTQLFDLGLVWVRANNSPSADITIMRPPNTATGVFVDGITNTFRYEPGIIQYKVNSYVAELFVDGVSVSSDTDLNNIIPISFLKLGPSVYSTFYPRGFYSQIIISASDKQYQAFQYLTQNSKYTKNAAYSNLQDNNLSTSETANTLNATYAMRALNIPNIKALSVSSCYQASAHTGLRFQDYSKYAGITTNGPALARVIDPTQTYANTPLTIDSNLDDLDNLELGTILTTGGTW